MKLRPFIIPLCLALYFSLWAIYGPRASSIASSIAITLFQVIYIAVSGTLVGVGLAILIMSASFLPVQNITLFLRPLVWLPFFVGWALPTPVFVISLVGVSAYATYRFLSSRFGLERNWTTALKDLGKQSLFHTLLYLLAFEIWSVDGWMASSSLNVEKTIFVFALLLMFVYAVNILFRTEFGSDAALERELILGETKGAKTSLTVWLILVTVVILLILALLQVIVGKFNLSSLNTLLGATHFIVTSREGIVDLSISAFEVIGGISMAGALAWIINKAMERKSIRHCLLPILPLTFVVPILAKHLEIAAIGWSSSPWSIATYVAFFGFYPFILAISNGHRFTSKCALVMGVYSALPYAFVMMFYSETVAASDGIGVYVVAMRNMLQPPRALAASLIIFCVFVCVSWIIAMVAERICKREQD